MLVEKDWLLSRPVYFWPAIIRTFADQSFDTGPFTLNLKKKNENNIKNANTRSPRIKNETHI